MFTHINYNYIKNKILTADFLWWLTLFLFMLIFHSRHYVNSDEGVILEGAWNLINNRILYFDFFEFVPPASFYAVFWIWKIFGAHYAAAKLIGLLAIFFSAIGIYKIARLISKNKLIYLMPALFIASSFSWPIINHNTFILPFIVWGIYFFIKAVNNFSANPVRHTPLAPLNNSSSITNLSNGAKDCATSGALLGLSVLFLQHKGIIVLFALFLYLIIMRLIKRNNAFLKLIPFLIIPAALPACLLLIKWPAKLLYENLIAFPLFHYMETNKISYYLFAFFFLLFACAAWKLRKNLNRTAGLLIFVQLFLLVSALQRPDSYHITSALFPLYCLLPLVVEKIRCQKNYNFYNAALLLAVAIIIFPSLTSLAVFPPFYSVKNHEILRFINQNCPGKYIYAGPFIPNFYFEAKKLNSTPYSILITNHQTEKQFIEARKYLEKNNPSCAVLNYGLSKKFNHDKNNPVDSYILKNYLPVFSSGGATVYKK
ncbi:hypothetical protein L6267_03680 [Candidatus Parcubacteria bacterium]|nr:hypothetical protein [Candidatus Parcubacteria bacterium]